MSGVCYFVAGTDTGVGKTRVTCALLAAARAQGLAVAGMKPIAAGGEWHDGHFISEDARLIAENSGQSSPYSEINPYCLLEPISPHIAANRARITVDIDLIATIGTRLRAKHDFVLVEGAGGWYTPIDDRRSMAEVAKALHCPIILVVGLRLGCLNHARLSLEAMRGSGCDFAGWIGSQIDANFAALPENLATLEMILGGPPLALLPFADATTDDAQRARAALPRLLASRGAYDT